MFEKIKSFYNKDHCDFSKGYIDPFDFFKPFYKVFIAFKVADLENKNPPSYFNQNAILFLTGLMATLLTSISCYHGVETLDISFSIEAGSYTLILSHELLILYCTRRNLPQYHNLLRALQTDFHYICTAEEKYRARFFKNQLKTWKICIITTIFTTGVPISMNIFSYIALFYFLATQDADIEGSRPLLFPFWMPNVDLSKSPVYESAFMFANFAVMLYSYIYTFKILSEIIWIRQIASRVDVVIWNIEDLLTDIHPFPFILIEDTYISVMILTQIIWIRQIASKVDVVIWKIQDLLADVHPATNKEESERFYNLIQSRMREIVMHHQSMYSLIEDYAIVFKKILLLEQIISCPVVCLSAYCLAEKFDNGEFHVILLLLCFATTVLYFIPCFMCTYLGFKVKSICDACWNIPFWNAGPVIRPYMVLIMQRSLRPLPLQAAGFQEISLKSFSATMTSAYSYFNMLRQTNL